MSDLKAKEQLSTDEWVAGYAIKFTDGTTEGNLLHKGSKESCERVRDMVPAISYSGPLKFESAHTFVMPIADWEVLCRAVI